MASYCTISLNEMESFLETRGFHQVNVDKCQELVWEKVSKQDGRLALRVYSSLTNGVSRGVGEDAIRIVIWDYSISRPVTGAIRTNRVAGWQDRMLAKLKSLASSFKFAKCPHCGNYMMERSGKYGTFLGCSNFPNCKHIAAKGM